MAGQMHVSSTAVGFRAMCAVLQEDLPQSCLTTASPASSVGHPSHEQEPLPDQASFVSRAGSTVSTPRSLRPGTVPKLDLSPAIALHMAALEGGEEEEAEPDLEEEEDRATERQAAVMASFDDLSGPDASDAGSESGSTVPSLAASPTASSRSMHDIRDGLDDADDPHHTALTTSDAPGLKRKNKNAAQRLDIGQPLPASQQQSLSVPALSEAPPSDLSPRDSLLPAEANHTSNSSLRAAAKVPCDPTSTAGNIAGDVEAAVVDGFRLTAVTDRPGLQEHTAAALLTGELDQGSTKSESASSLSTASSISEEMELAGGFLSQEASFTTDQAQSSLDVTQPQAVAVTGGIQASQPGPEAEAEPEIAVEADDVQLSFEPAHAGHLLIPAPPPLLLPDPTAASLPPPLTQGIGKKESHQEEQWHLAPDLLAYAEAAMEEGDEAADQHALVSSKSAERTAATPPGRTSSPEAASEAVAEGVAEAARHGQQADDIAAELFEELLDDAVQAMTATGELKLYCASCDFSTAALSCL